MFIARTIFWFCVAMLLMPHEPDLGIKQPVDFAAPIREAMWHRLASVEQDVAKAQAGAAHP